MLTLSGQAAIYNGGLQPGLQIGNGVGQFLKQVENAAGKVNEFAKRNKLATKLDTVVDVIPGARGYLDANTGGLYSRGVQAARYRGYGKKKKAKANGKGKKK
jgi:hypothetical protein